MESKPPFPFPKYTQIGKEIKPFSLENQLQIESTFKESNLQCLHKGNYEFHGWNALSDKMSLCRLR